MKDKEKAKEIAEKNGKIKMYLHGFEIDGALFDALPECYNSAMEMAAWKEQQMIAFIDDEVNLINDLLKKEETKEMLYRYEGIIDGLLRVKNKIINK